VFLRGTNQVLQSARIMVLAYGLRLLLACLLLIMGTGLLAVPLAGLVGSFLQRQMARRGCLGLLGLRPPAASETGGSLLPILWPNSWRVGLQLFSSWLASYANVMICSKVFGLGVNAQYGLSVQVAQILASMSSVWLTVKWPLVGQYRACQNHAALRRLLWPRLWLQSLTYLMLTLPAFWAGPTLLRWLGSNKELLPEGWFGLLLLGAFLDLQFSFWTTLLSTENRIPSLWPTVATNVLSLGLVLALVGFGSFGPGAFVLAPFISYSLFSYWYWPMAGAKSLQTSWLRFTFLRPH
jgi:hypothetical protein